MTTETALATREQPQLTPFEVIERVITQGDLAKMSAPERVAFYWRTCESLGLNPLTRPFEFISLNGKLTMYARKDATDQLRKLNAVTVTEIRREKDVDLGLLTIYARGRDKSGREDEATGVVFIKGLAGEALANALMKAETKAKRRLTLSLVGLGFLDESEIEGIGDKVEVDPDTGEVHERPKPRTLLESIRVQQAAMDTTTSEGGALPETITEDVEEGQIREDPVWMAGAASTDTAEAPSEPTATPVVDVATILRDSAAASGMKGPITEPQKARLGAILAGLRGTGIVTVAIDVLWGEGTWRDLSAAQGQALINAADSMGTDEFLGAIRAIAERARAAA